VGVHKGFEGDLSPGQCRAPAGDFSLAKLEPIGQLQQRRVRFAGDDVGDGLHIDVGDAIDSDPAGTRIHIECEVGGLSQGWILRRAHLCIDEPHRLHLVGVLPGHDPLQRGGLRLGRGGIDHQLHLAVALADRAGPMIDPGCAQTCQVGVSVMAALDVKNDGRLAITAVWQDAELAGAAEIAVAIGQFQTVNFPRCRLVFLLIFVMLKCSVGVVSFARLTRVVHCFQLWKEA